MRPALLILATLSASCSQAPRNDLPTWHPLPSVTTASLRGLCAVDDRVAWASGSGGTVLRTLDGGTTWLTHRVAGAEQLDFRDVEAFDHERAIVLSAGKPARMFATADGGATFREVYANDAPDAFFDAFDFAAEGFGLAFSDPVDGAFLVVRTTDHGASWQRISPRALPAPLEGEAGFAASGTCVAVHDATHAWIGTGGATPRVLRTTDGGATWAHHAAPLRDDGASAGIFSLAFRDATHGIAVGGDYREPDASRGNAARTEDGGATWQPITPGPRGFRSCVAHVPGSIIWVAVGTSGSDVSLDDGHTWQALGDRGYHVLAFPARGDGWAAGADGRLARLRLRPDH